MPEVTISAPIFFHPTWITVVSRLEVLQSVLDAKFSFRFDLADDRTEAPGIFFLLVVCQLPFAPVCTGSVPLAPFCKLIYRELPLHFPFGGGPPLVVVAADPDAGRGRLAGFLRLSRHVSNSSWR